jgi:hypothetical protein
MKAIILGTAAALALTACAQRQPTIMTWTATGTAGIPLHQALAECRYDVVKEPTNFTQLFLLSGQSPIAASGHVQGLSAQGETMFELCMRSRGYAPGGMTAYTGGN